MITVYLSYLLLFLLHLLMLGGYNHMMAAHSLNSSKQENDNHYVTAGRKSGISKPIKLIKNAHSFNRLDAMLKHQINEKLINLGRRTNSENKDDQEKVVKSFRRQMAYIVPHYLHPNNNLILSLKPFVNLHSFHEVIKKILNKYIYDSWIVNLLSLIDAAHRYKLFT